MKNNLIQKNRLEGWENRQVKDCFGKIIGGGTPSRVLPEYWNGDIPWVTVKDLHEKIYIDRAQEKITEKGLTASASHMVPAQSIITSTRMGVGRFFVNKIPVAINQDMKGLVPKVGCDTIFLCLALSQKKRELEAKATGTTVKGIKQDELLSVNLLIPPLLEQKKIAEILTTVDSEIQKTDEIILQTEKLKNGLMHELLSSYNGNQKTKYKPVFLKDVIKITNGQVDPKKTPYNKMALIAPNHIESNSGRIIKYETAEEQQAISGKYLVKKGDVVYSKIRPYLKKVTIATRDCLCSADMYPIQGVEDFLDNEFLFQVLLSEDFTNFANSNSGRTGIPKINREELGKYNFLLPTISEQKKISNVLSATDNKISVNEILKEKLTTLKKGLMSDLLSGKVRVKSDI